MEPTPAGLADADAELWAAAVDLLAQRYRHDRHEVAAAVRSRSGAVHLGVHMAGSAGRSSICAEGMALGAALTDGDLEIDTVLAVLYRPAGTIRPIAPCGVCRELLVDYCPDAWIYLCTDIVPGPAHDPDDAVGFPRPARTTGTAVRTRVRDLMPGKNPRSW